MWTQKFCLICIYILRNYAFQISNEALFLAFLQPVANRLKSFILPSNRMGKTSSASTFSNRPPWRHLTALLQVLWDILQVKSTVCIDRYIFYWILFKWIYQRYGIWKSLFILYNSLSWTLVRDSWFFLPVCLQANLWVCRYVTIQCSLDSFAWHRSPIYTV